MKIIAIICLMFCIFATYGETISELQYQLQKVEENIKENPTPGWQLWDTQALKEKRLKKHQAEKERLENRLRELKRKGKKITHVDVIVLRDSGPWTHNEIGDSEPDLYLKTAQKGWFKTHYRETDTKHNIKVNESVSFTLSNASFSYNSPIEIEVWDRDIQNDDHIFTVKVNGDGKSPMVGEAAGLKYEIYWQ